MTNVRHPLFSAVYNRWSIFSLNLLGDPEMRVWTRRPLPVCFELTLQVHRPEWIEATIRAVRATVDERTLRLADDAACLEALLAQVQPSGRAARLLLNEHEAIEAVEVLAAASAQD